MAPTRTFGQQLRALREGCGLTRREVEDRTGVSQRHQSYLEKDQREPGRSVLEALAKEFGPEVYKAAFPDLVILKTHSAKSPTARESSFPDWAMAESPDALTPEPRIALAGV